MKIQVRKMLDDGFTFNQMDEASLEMIGAAKSKKKGGKDEKVDRVRIGY